MEPQRSQVRHEVMKMKPGLCWRPQSVGDARITGDTCQIQIQWKQCFQKSGAKPRKTDDAVSNPGREAPAKPIDSRYRTQDLELTLLGFCFALVQYCLAIFPFLPFGMIKYILCHCILKVCNLLLILQGVTIKKLP